MKQVVASITDRGQVTVPAEVRKLLGATLRGKLVFEIDGQEVRLRVPMTLEQIAGSIPPLHHPEDFKAIERAAKDDHVERVVRKMAEN